MQRLVFVFLLAVMWCLPGLSIGKAPSTAALEGAMRSKMAQTFEEEEEANIDDQDEITKALEEVASKSNLKKIPWSEFFKKMQKEAKSVEERYDRFRESLSFEEIMLEAKLQDAVPTTQKYARPNYGKETTSVRFVYLTDSSAHESKTIVNEVKRVLASVRGAHPGAKILFATEFAYTLNLGLPIRFAKEDNEDVDMDEAYKPLMATTDKLNMDILALDDYVLVNDEDVESIMYKVGAYLVRMSEKDHPEFINDPLDMSGEEWRKLSSSVATSTLGERLRNQQWANYIKAVEPFYDIVIVYGGNGHIDIDTARAAQHVPEMVGKEYVLFNFYSLEDSSEFFAFQEGYTQMLCKDDTRANLVVRSKEELADETQQFCDSFEWNRQSVMYIKTTQEQEKEYVRSLPEGKQQAYKQLIPKMKQAHLRDGLRIATFEVLLPDESGND